MLSTSKQLNYGGVLQAYALLDLVKEITNQESVESINYDLTKDSFEIFGEPSSQLIKIYSKPALKRLYIRFVYPILMQAHRVRRKRTFLFLEHFMSQSQKVYKEPEDLWKDCPYDLIIVGSDQMWRYLSRAHKFSLLSGLNTENVKKIAYAVSLGWKELPKEFQELYKASIQQFNAISVREPSSVERISTLIDHAKPVEFCVDPSLLYGRSRWHHLANKAPIDSKIVAGEYALVYWLADVENMEPIFEGLKKRNFSRIIVLFSWYKKMLGGRPQRVKATMDRATKQYGVQWVIEAGPTEFLSYISHASYIITCSFHATLFSLIFSKPVRTFTHIYSPEDLMATRLEDFKERYQLDNVVFRGLEGNCDFSKDDHLNYEAVWHQIEEDRRDSMTYLIDSLTATGVKVNKTVEEVL